PGTLVVISEPGLNPSVVFQSVGSIGLPATLTGIARTLKWTRLPVTVVSSGTVKSSLGNGCRQTLGSRSSQPARFGTDSADAPAGSASSTAATPASAARPKEVFGMKLPASTSSRKWSSQKWIGVAAGGISSRTSIV